MLTAIIFLFSFILFNTNGEGVYKTLESCVFKELSKSNEKSRIRCAFKCDLTDCKAFQYDTVTKLCTLYSFKEICPSNTACPNVTIFINNRYNGQVLVTEFGLI